MVLTAAPPPTHPSLYLSLITPSLRSSQAVDADLFSNVTYRIKSAEDMKLFSVNPISGELSVLQTLDFEDLASMGMGANYTFQVEAVDQAGTMPPGEATVTIRITVRSCRSVFTVFVMSDSKSKKYCCFTLIVSTHDGD